MDEPSASEAGSSLAARAFKHALRAHHGRSRRGSTDIEHPVAVAELLDRAGFGEQVVAAALLHDVVEDTSESLAEIEAEFGPEVRGYVEALTEDASIDSYADRKAEHRERVLAAGSGPAAIYLADKLARARAYADAGEPVEAERLDHYRATLQLFARRRPELPFLAELAVELGGLEAG